MTTTASKVCVVVAVTALVVSAQSIPVVGLPTSPPAVGGDPRVDPSEFRVTMFATGLNFPHSIQQLADGSIMVGTSTPSPGGGLFGSSGTLLHLVDGNGDGVADNSPGAVLYNGLPGYLTAVRRIGNLVFATTNSGTVSQITALRAGASPADPYSRVGSISLTFPQGWEHRSYASAVRPTPGASATYDLFFNVGSQFNEVASNTSVAISAPDLPGLAPTTVFGESIYRITIEDTGAGLLLSNLTQIASGLRNAAGIAVEPATGDLYFEDNGIDGPNTAEFDFGNEPLSADELNRIGAADIGGSVEHFGFPHDYVRYRTGERVGSGGIEPLAVFHPIPPSSTNESEGPNEIAFSPPGFPAGVHNGVYIGFHGRGNLGGLENEENPVLYYDRGDGSYFHFIANSEPGIGHPDGLLSTQDSLFVADLSSTGGLDASGVAQGVLYQIKATTPSTTTTTTPSTTTTTTTTPPTTTTTTTPPSPTGSSIWSPTARPANFAAQYTAIELGTRFRSDVDGTIAGVRFYKAPGDPGTHEGKLWSATGQLLARATFTNETESGWQQVNFATPVAVTANTNYVVSFHTSAGFFGYDPNYFATTGVDNGLLHALPDSAAGPNGVYTRDGGFPNQGYLASNWWADVVFSTSTTPSTAPSADLIAFSDVTAPNGLVQPLTGMYVHAVAFGDVNGDGWQDLFVGTFADYPESNYQVRGASGPSPDRLLLGGPNGFTVDASFPTMFGRTAGATFVDLENTGYPDLVILRHTADRLRGDAPSVVLHNERGRFSAPTPLPGVHQGRAAAVLDYDADGLIDLFVSDDRYDGGASVLLRNRGGLQFDDVTVAARLSSVQAFGATSADLNADGWPDLVAVGTTPTDGPASSPAARVFLNNRDGTFREADNSAFTWTTYNITDDATGVAVGDLNRDGRPDVVIGQHYGSTLEEQKKAPVRVYLHRGWGPTGDPLFEDVTTAAGVPNFATKSPDVQIVDLDNDGWPDVVTTASAADGTRPTVLRNLGLADGVPRFSSPSGLGSPHYWVNVSAADVDRDGRLDLFVGDFEPSRPSLLFRNETPGGHWLEVAVAQPGQGVGASVEVYPAGQLGNAASLLGLQTITTSTGYASGVPPIAHFGLGSQTSVDVRVRFPAGGRVVDLTAVPAGQQLHVRLP